MNRILSDRFLRRYRKAPKSVQKAFKKQLSLLLQDLLHPSPHAKKYDEANDIWQARVTRGWRFCFTIEDDTYVILDITPHPK